MRTGTVVRIGLVVALLAAAGTAGYGAAAELLPDEGQAARGLLVARHAVGAAETIEQVVESRVRQCLQHRVSVTLDGDVVLTATLEQLGAQLDQAALRAALAAVGRSGSLWQRLDDALQARRGRLVVAVPCRLPSEPLARRLARLKAELDVRPTPARWDFDEQAVVPHRDGAAIDVLELARTIERAARTGRARVELPVAALVPAATSEVVAGIDRSTLISRYETRFAYLGAQGGRANNIQRAAGAVDGTVLMPGDVVSFNALVGPRSIDNGFAKAGEIYRGEMREGVGGGTCQVASTLYSAAYFGALEIVERSPHSRPSGYVPLGLDATVAYPHVDLKLRNPFPFPLVIRAVLEPGLLAFELWGETRPATVKYDAATIRVRPYKRKIREASWLAEGRVVRKQKGIQGLTVLKFRRIRYHDGTEREEKTTDEYPATDEIYIVAPDTDVETELPPLPEGVELDA